MASWQPTEREASTIPTPPNEPPVFALGSDQDGTNKRGASLMSWKPSIIHWTPAPSKPITRPPSLSTATATACPIFLKMSSSWILRLLQRPASGLEHCRRQQPVAGPAQHRFPAPSYCASDQCRRGPLDQCADQFQHNQLPRLHQFHFENRLGGFGAIWLSLPSGAPATNYILVTAWSGANQPP